MKGREKGNSQNRNILSKGIRYKEKFSRREFSYMGIIKSRFDIRKYFKTNKKYKNTVFRKLFSDKEKLLELYNGLNGTSYTNVDDLRINTLDSVVYLTMKNDISFVFGFEMYLFEHQSTLNPNMPLRNLIYVSNLLNKELELDKRQESIYGEKLIKVPMPKFYVFYNGDKRVEDMFEYKLSDAYEKKIDNPSLELKVTVLNINKGRNKVLMEHCKTLRDYSLFVDKARSNYNEQKAGEKNIDKAVNEAVDYCIGEGILDEFLRENRAEVVKMSILERTWEEEKDKIAASYKEMYKEKYKEMYEKKYKEMYEKMYKEEYIQQGIEQGEENVYKILIQAKLDKGKSIEEIAQEVELSIEEVKKYIDSN